MGSIEAAGCAGILLTGGRSVRMGRDKAMMPAAGGGSWAGRAGALLASATSPVVEVGAGVSGLHAVGDDEPGAGPLVAVMTGWRELSKWAAPEAAIVLSCDLPLLGTELLARLATWSGAADAVPVLDGRPQWCCARYSAPTLRATAALVARGRRDLRALGDAGQAGGSIDWLGREQLGELLDTLADADTPAELAALGLGAAELSGAGATIDVGDGNRD